MKQSLIIGLSLSLFASSVMAQSHPRPPAAPVVIVPAPAPAMSETMIFGPNGQITIIHQQGTDTFVTTSPNP